MNLNSRSWYVRWFDLAITVIGDFQDRPSLRDRVFRDGTNLCYFMRCMLVYLPLVLVFELLVGAILVIDIVVLPLHFVGGVSYGKFWLWVAIVIGACVGLGFGIESLKSAGRRAQRARKAEPAAPPPAPGFLRIIGTWLMAKKRRICPLITFEAERTPSTPTHW